MSWRAQIDWVRTIRDDDIVAMRRAGLKLREIAGKIGISHVMVHKVLRQRGEASPPRKDLLPEAACARLADRIAEIHADRSMS